MSTTNVGPPPSDIPKLHPPDPSHIYFIWHEWILSNGYPTAENVFEYFASSPFYDKSSNNQVLRMQTLFSTGQPIANEAEELRRFTGIEFAVVHAQPPFFIIHKRERLSPDEVRPLAAYFVVRDRVYQSPDVYTIVSNRLLTTLHGLESSLETLRKHRPDYTPRTGFVWPITNPAAAISSAADKDKKRGETPAMDSPTPTAASASVSGKTGRQQVQLAPLMRAMETTAQHTRMTVQEASAPPPEEPTRVSAPPARVPSLKQRTPEDAAPVIQPVPPPNKSAPGAGKKKRKRTLAPTTP